MADYSVPAVFPFPFEPYSIQIDFMRSLYTTLQEEKIGIFESPTGTGKSLSIICGSLKWLIDYEQKKKSRQEALLLGDITVLKPLQQSVQRSVQQSEIQRKEDDWLYLYDEQKRLQDEIYKIKRTEEKRKHREEKVKRLKEQYSTSLVNKSNKKQCINEQETHGQVDEEDIILQDYNSDHEADDLDTQDIGEEDEEDEEDNIIKIYYASRTHSQLTQFIHEVQKTCYKDNITLIPLASRNSLCLNKTVKRLNSISLINDRCIQLQRNTKKTSASKRHKTHGSKGCPFYKPVAIETIRDVAISEIHDIEQLVDIGKQVEGCPYYGTRYALPLVQLVVLPYQILLHENMRQSVGIKLKGNVVIIDEAHNLLDTISSIHSVRITLYHINNTIVQLTMYRDRYKTHLKANNLMYIEQLMYILTSFQKLLTSSTSTDCQEQLLRLHQFLLTTNIDNINMFKLLNFCKRSEISKKLNGFTEQYMKEDEQVITHKEEDSPRCPLLLIEQFISSLTSTDSHCRIVIKRGDEECYIKYILLNPSIHFSSIINECRSVIVTGGTMKPFSEFKDQLLTSIGVQSTRIMEFSCGHVISEDQLLAISLSKGPANVKFNFNFEHRNDISMIQELGRTVCNIITVIPGGVVCFFPSYDYEHKVFNIWEENGILDKIISKKQIYREPKHSSQVDLLLSQYTRCVEFNTGGNGGALLSCVVGGKLSEGINFADILGRCIIMIGLPYPNIKSKELIEKMNYINSTLASDNGKLAGNVYYENLCMKAVNQSIGRAIRHSNDYATIILIDDRYSNHTVYSKLPDWIVQQLLITHSFGQCLSALRKFFMTKNKK